ncbi:hypothetical protein [Treponema zioleckii]|uniref:hypothetical protein n=1 Tax=Treponema zioleckii TaxID=331680 RepID=UPI00168B8F08|nr:hypothetical protein [Treponema zioleckii]
MNFFKTAHRCAAWLPLALTAVCFFSCTPQISVKATQGDGASISFKTGFSENAAKTLRSISGLPENGAIFSAQDIILVLTDAGISDAKASTPSVTSLNASGNVPSVAKSELFKAMVLSRTKNSLTLTIGPKQIQEIYNRLDDESKSYFDLMLIPCLIGEKMSVKQYEDLLSSMYGPTFAKELVTGNLSILLESPDGKKTNKVSVTLGELLTLTDAKNWSVSW